MDRLNLLLYQARRLSRSPLVPGPVIMEPGPAGWTVTAHLCGKSPVDCKRETAVYTSKSGAREHTDDLAKRYPGGGDFPVIILDVMG
ncbi:hypothetical protein [Acutalibacter caecimuris]|uniref:hypothetical protein n=1 Tax=Acutalibacter caecimuris TaxID=3093657 RepID=UPI002AC9262C|nr:hypothetical protein [Acutalibacter sp. M00118]